MEDLNIQDMQNGNWRSINKSIADAAWRQFIDFTAYKAENAGRLSPRIDPGGTTQDCSGCGGIFPKDLSVRIHNCPHCGLILDRDHNAAINILARGMASIRLDR
jgi:putative transposase